MDKSPDAFRTISEVAEVLETPAHVLRFWESRFPQIRPVKRAGGRRYYRPTDVALLTGIKHLLHEEGMTIRGVQKILREQGVRHVAGLSGQDVPDDTDSAEAALEAALAANFGVEVASTLSQDQVETAQIVALETALRSRAGKSASDPVGSLPLFDIPAPETGPAEVEPTAADTATPIFADPIVAEPDASDDDSMLSQATAPSIPATDISAPEPQEAAPDDRSLLDRLRALPHGSLAHDPQAQALRIRLAALAARLAAPPPHTPL